MRTLATTDQLNFVESISRFSNLYFIDTLDRVVASVDELNKLSSIDEHVKLLEKTLESLEEKVESCARVDEIRRIDQRSREFATKMKVQQVENKFVKYAKNDYVFEIKGRMDIMDADMAKLASQKDIEKVTHNIFEDVSNKLSLMVSKNQLNDFSKGNDMNLAKLKTDISYDRRQIDNIKATLHDMYDTIK